MNRLQGKSAIIIGATSGMGEAIAKMYAAEGAEVVFTGRREKNGIAIEESIRKEGGNAVFVRADSNIK